MPKLPEFTTQVGDLYYSKATGRVSMHLSDDLAQDAFFSILPSMLYEWRDQMDALIKEIEENG